jgi:RHS repeat-associated protein
VRLAGTGTAKKNSEPNQQLVFIHNDHLGTPKLMTDQQQAVVWQSESLPFGKTTHKVADATQKLRFPGQYEDEETGFHYNYFRDYDPSLGRYIQSDPIGLRGGVNTFGYVLGNPVGMVDPLGLVYGYTNGSSRYSQSNTVARLAKQEIPNEQINTVGTFASNVFLAGSLSPCSFACAGISTFIDGSLAAMSLASGDVDSAILGMAPGASGKGVSFFTKNSGIFTKYADDVFGVTTNLIMQKGINNAKSLGGYPHKKTETFGSCPYGS